LLTLGNQAQGVATQIESRIGLQEQLSEINARLSEIDASINQRKNLEDQLQIALQTRADAKAENQRARTEMEELKSRIDGLEKLTQASCPTCGAPLSENERLKRIDELNQQGKQMGDRFRANVEFLQKSEQEVKDIEAQIKELSKIESQRDGLTQAKAQLEARLNAINQLDSEWQATGLPRKNEVEL